MPTPPPPTILHQTTITTTLGNLVALTSPAGLCLLEFTTRHTLTRQFEITTENFSPSRITRVSDADSDPILSQIQHELNHYFNGCLRTFHTPLDLRGTPYQLRVWKTLNQIPYGQTITYTQLANRVSQSPSSHRTSPRAAGRANGSNRLAIIIPCHRVIRTDGNLAGYAGGLERKRWLIAHEQNYLRPKRGPLP